LLCAMNIYANALVLLSLTNALERQ
jgi:hypothetical protein